jgi:4-amino-4-deoxychorismate lyase
MLINGLPGDQISANDRGLMYGDGVFRTVLLRSGKLLHWQQHYLKLKSDCEAIGIECPSSSLLDADLKQLLNDQFDGVVKVIVTRGIGSRGYTPPVSPNATRIVYLSPLPVYPQSNASAGICMHICSIRLGHQPRLSKIKHLNRLENVLAASEWTDTNIAEGLLMDQTGCVIEATRSNLFLVKSGALYTPDLSNCGVAGLQRERVLSWARNNNIKFSVTSLTMSDVIESDEIFIVNSVIGLWPVREMQGFKRDYFPLSHTIQNWLNNAST